MKIISLSELDNYMKKGALLIDVRLPSDYIKNHINGAINMPYNNILTMIKSYSKDKILILYCDHGVQSSRVGRMLLSLGFTNVNILRKDSI